MTPLGQKEKDYLASGGALRNGQIPDAPALNSATLTPNDPIVIPPPTPLPPTGQEFASASLESILSQFNAPAPEEAQGDELQKLILGTMDTIGTKSARQAELEKKAGLDTSRSELQNVINQLQGLSKEAAAIPLQIQEEFKGRGVTAAGIAPIQTGRLRENAIKSLGLAAIGQTLQGNITSAENSIAKAIELEFAPQERKLETLKQLYTFNKDALERRDKKRANALNIALAERTRILEEQKADKKYTSDLMLAAAKLGAPQSVLEQMKESTPDQAVALGAKFFGAEFEQAAKQQAFENGIALRSIAVQEANAGLARRKTLIDLASAGDKEAITELGYDPRNLPLSSEEIKKFEDQQNIISNDIKTVKGILNNNIGLSTSSGLARGTTALAPLFINPAVGLYAKQKRNDFLSDAQYIINNLTFKKVKELSDAGIKLTPISEKELKLMGQASDVLVGGAEFDESGNLLGFKLSEARVKEQLQSVLKHYQNAYDDISVNLLLSEDDQNEIINK